VQVNGPLPEETQHGFHIFQAAERIGRVETDAGARAVETSEDFDQRGTSEAIVVLDGEAYTGALERGNNGPERRRDKVGTCSARVLSSLEASDGRPARIGA
jgi:hypothetical protein